jgi:GNAT superfamily N-acetyltransferase
MSPNLAHKTVPAIEPSIRLAEFSDMERLLFLGQEFHKYADLSKFGLGYDRVKFSGVLAHFINNDNCILLVAELDGKVVGSIAGMIAPWFLDPGQINASENWWFVLPEYRGTMGIDLLVALEEWARVKGAKCMAMAGFAEKRLTALTRLYRQKGYRPLEMHFVKEM